MKSSTSGPVILWFRRDLRLGDHAALAAAVATGRPVVPVFVHDETVAALGAAAKWRLGEGLRVFAATLEASGSRLVLRRGAASDVVRHLAEETGAGAVWWSRAHDPASRARDRGVAEVLAAAGVEAEEFPGALLFEPATVATGAGRPYAVYTPFWRAIRTRDAGRPLAPPRRLRGPARWPASDRLEDWCLGAGVARGGPVLARHAGVGEAVAQARLDGFIAGRLGRYPEGRDFPGEAATSGLSENLAWGEVSPRQVWMAGLGAREEGNPGAEKFLAELGWREFAWHMLRHHPTLAETSWRAGWEQFPWRGDAPAAERWRRGMTGEPLVDAAMREMYVTGRMHNRARMVAASYLTKQLLTDWRIGQAWFADCLTDWDPAANALNWQWVAGSGPDAAPFFRIFNPRTQAERFDPGGRYRQRFLAEGQAAPPETALAFFEAVPRAWGLSPAQAYPAPLVDLGLARAAALAAHAGLGNAPAG